MFGVYLQRPLIFRVATRRLAFLLSASHLSGVRQSQPKAAPVLTQAGPAVKELAMATEGKAAKGKAAKGKAVQEEVVGVAVLLQASQRYSCRAKASKSIVARIWKCLCYN